MSNKDKINKIFEDSLKVKNEFISNEKNVDAISEAALAMIKCFQAGGKVIVFGNGGSASDSQHLAAELVIRFEKERKALPCIALTTNTSSLTSVANDYDYTKSFSRQLEAFVAPGDIVIAISTSGTSGNVLEAAKFARQKKATVISLTGRDGGSLAGESDISIIVRADSTARIQEVHITIIHALCSIIEEAF